MAVNYATGTSAWLNQLPGSQAAGLLTQMSNLPAGAVNQVLPSSIPSISGQGQNYVPGYGIAPYSSNLTPNQQANLELYNKLKNTPWRQDEAEIIRKSLEVQGVFGSGGTVSTFTPPNVSSVPPAPDLSTTRQGSGFTVIGQSDPWLTPEELAAKTHALPNYVSSSPSGGGGGGGGGAVATGGKTQPNPLGIGTPPEQAGTAGPQGVNISGYQPGAGVPYQSPGGLFSNNPMPTGASGGQTGPVSMQQQSPQAALAAYQQTPGYQLLFGQGQYQQSPGYQYAVNEALKQVQQNAASRGLLESGSVMKELTDRAQGMALQDYGNWWNRQNQAFTDYQNRLAGLAGGNVGGDMAFNLGANLGQGSLQTGSNLGSLFGNLGSAGYGGIVNTGAAQAANINQAGAQQAQINAANQATQLAGAVYNKGLF